MLVFQADVYAILACIHEIETQDRPEKNVSICSYSQAALKVLQAAKMSPLVWQCQKALNDIPTQHTVGLYQVPGLAGVQGNEVADRITRDGSVQRFVGPESSLGVSRQNMRRKMKRWMENQHLALWCGPCSTERQAEYWSLAQTWLQGPNYCPLIGHNPGLLLACLLDTTPWKDIYI